VPLRLLSVTFDADDPRGLAEFWSQVTGYSVESPSEYMAAIKGDGSVGPQFMFLKVPEGKTAKNRVHVDLGSPDLDAEVDRVLGLGASLVGRYAEYGITWATFRDPEGNEFCIGQHEPPSHAATA
jgi:predicted enzyme related to lactoylglutathione lyase